MLREKLKIFAVSLTTILILAALNSKALSQSEPEITYASYLGGDGFDGIYDMAICADSTVVVIGLTGSSDFPGADGAASNFDIFVSKISIPDNLEETGQVFWTVLLGGSSAEREWMAVAVGDDGMIYVAGTIVSSDFQEVNSIYTGGGTDGILAVLDADGNVLIASRIGGNEFDTASAIELDVAGNIYLTGWTNSDDFSGGALDRMDAWVLKLSRSGNVITEENLFFYGGSDNDFPFGIAVDPQGKVHLAGHTSSNDLPLKDASDGIYGGIGGDLFFAVFNTDNSLETASYWGGSSYEESEGISLDNQGNFYIWGTTSSNDLTTIDPIQSDYGGSGDGIIVVLDSLGKSVISSSYLGGANFEHIFGGFVDDFGNLLFSGTSFSPDFLRDNSNSQFSQRPDAVAQQDETTGFWFFSSADKETQTGGRLPGNANSEVELKDVMILSAALMITSGLAFGEVTTTSNAYQSETSDESDAVLMATSMEGVIDNPMPAIQIQATLVSNPDSLILGDTTRFSLKVTNTGSVPLENVFYHVFSPRFGDYPWTVGSLPAGEMRESQTTDIELHVATVDTFTFFAEGDYGSEKVESNRIKLPFEVKPKIIACNYYTTVGDQLNCSESNMVDIYVDGNLVVDDMELFGASPVINTEFVSVSPTIEIVAGDMPNHNNPIAMETFDLIIPGEAPPEAVQVIITDPASQQNCVEVKVVPDARLIAKNQNEVDLRMFHVAPGQPELTIIVPTDSIPPQMLSFEEHTEYLSVAPELQTVQVSEKTFEVDLSEKSNEALTLFIADDNSHPNFIVVVRDTGGVSLPVTQVPSDTGSPKLAVSFVNNDNAFLSVGDTALVKLIVRNTGTTPSFETGGEIEEIYNDQRTTTSFNIGELAAGASHTIQFKDLYGLAGESTYTVKATGKDSNGNTVESNEDELRFEIRPNIIKAMFHVYNSRYHRYVSFYEGKSPARLNQTANEIVDIYIDSVKVIEDAKPFGSSGIVNTTIQSVNPLIEITAGDAPDNSEPYVSFQLDLVTEDTTLSYQNHIILADAPGDTMAAFLTKDFGFAAEDPSKVEFRFLHAAPAFGGLTVDVPGSSLASQSLNYGEFSDYLSVTPGSWDFNFTNGAAHKINLDLSDYDGQVLSMAIIPDTTGADSGFTFIARDTSGAALPVGNVTSVFQGDKTIPQEFTLFQNYPNPFNPETTIRYNLPETADVQLLIFDITGKLVAQLVDESQQPGEYSVIWNGLSDTGLEIASGVYFYRMSAGSFRKVAKMIFIK